MSGGQEWFDSTKGTMSTTYAQSAEAQTQTNNDSDESQRTVAEVDGWTFTGTGSAIVNGGHRDMRTTKVSSETYVSESGHVLKLYGHGKVEVAKDQKRKHVSVHNGIMSATERAYNFMRNHS